jgi:hypothetical protein
MARFAAAFCFLSSVRLPNELAFYYYLLLRLR